MHMLLLDTTSEINLSLTMPNSVVHVPAICPESDLHSPGAFLPNERRTERRELVFRLGMASLLVGDLTQTMVEQQAIRLLGELAGLRKSVSLIQIRPPGDNLPLLIPEAERQGVPLSLSPTTLVLL